MCYKNAKKSILEKENNIGEIVLNVIQLFCFCREHLNYLSLSGAKNVQMPEL